jgi:hypothetical protein
VTRRWVIVVLATVAALGLAAGPAAGAAPIAAGRVSARLELPKTRVRTGGTLKGHLVLTNSGDQTVDLNQSCAPKWQVVLGKGPKPPGVVFALVCTTEQFLVKPGTTRLPFEVSAGRKPGRYRAFLVASLPSFPTAKPVRVMVISAG